jgi:hypothetical protein
MAELRTIVITETFMVDGVLTDLDAVPNFTDENAAASGIIRLQDDEVVVAADTALTKSATGTYTYSFTESPNSYTYGYWIKWVYDSTTYYDYHTIAGGSAAITTKTAYKNYADISGTDDDDLLDQLVVRATSAMESFCGRKFQHDTYRERYNGTGDTELYLKQYPLTEIKMLSIGTTDVIKFKNTSTDAYNAYVRVSSTSMILTIQGGTDDGSNTLTLTDYTITTLTAAIEALTGWTATAVNSGYGVWNAEEILPASGLECHDSYAYVQCPDVPECSFRTDDNKGVIRLSTGFPVGYQNVIVSYAAGYSTMPDDLIQICLDLVNVYYKSRKTDSTVEAEKLGDHYIKYSKDGGGGARDIPAHIQKRLAPYRKWRLAV